MQKINEFYCKDEIYNTQKACIESGNSWVSNIEVILNPSDSCLNPNNYDSNKFLCFDQLLFESTMKSLFDEFNVIVSGL